MMQCRLIDLSERRTGDRILGHVRKEGRSIVWYIEFGGIIVEIGRNGSLPVIE